ADRGPAVPGHDDPALEGQGDDGRGVCRGDAPGGGRGVGGQQVWGVLAEEVDEGGTARPHEAGGQPTVIDHHWPPFCTTRRTSDSASVSRASSIAARRSSASWVWAAFPVGGGGVGSSSCGSGRRTCSNFWATFVPPYVHHES